MTPNEYTRIRQDLGTQGEVAEKLGVRLNTVSRRELGHRPIPREAQLALLYLQERAKKRQKRLGTTKRTSRRA